MNRVQKGHFYEQAAADFLQSQGYTILSHNYRSHHAEIDIIAREGGYLVFVEVKYRKNATCQHPLASVDAKKQRHISKAAIGYLKAHGYGADCACRFDVVAFLDTEPSLYKNAFDICDAFHW